MKFIYKRLPNNKHMFFNRKLQRHYNFYLYPAGRQTGHDNKGTKIYAKRIGGLIIKGNQSNNPLRKSII